MAELEFDVRKLAPQFMAIFTGTMMRNHQEIDQLWGVRFSDAKPFLREYEMWESNAGNMMLGTGHYTRAWAEKMSRLLD